MINILKNQLLRFSVLCSSVAFFLLFSNTVFGVDFFEDDADILWQSGLNLHFKYAQQDSTKYGENDHPVDLNAKDLTAALKVLEFVEKRFLSGERVRAVFSVSQIRLLSQHLVHGLTTAQPEQDIIFVMEGGNRKLLFLAEKNFVAGRAFFKEGKLNIILGEYDRARNDAFEKVYDPSGRAAIPYSFHYGRRLKDSKKFKAKIITKPGVVQKNFGKKLRQDWLLIDLASAAKAYVHQSNGRQNLSTQPTQHSQMEAVKLTRERREMRSEMARMRKEMKQMNAGGGASPKTHEERILILDALFAKSLISQAEYDGRRLEILGDI